MKNIPFIKNPGGQCLQANALMALKYFYPNRDFNFALINKKMRHREEKWSTPSQAAVALNDLGLEAKAYSSKDIETEREKIVESFKEAFGEDYDKLIDNIDLDNEVYFHKRAKEEDIFKKKETSLNQMKEYLKQGCLVTVTIDWNVLKKKDGPFQGHAVMILDIDDETVEIHDPDEGPNMEYPRDLFKEAYNVQAVDDDVLVVFGKKES